MKICDVCKEKVAAFSAQSVYGGDLCPACSAKVNSEMEKIRVKYDQLAKKEFEDFISVLTVNPPREAEKDGRINKHKR